MVPQHRAHQPLGRILVILLAAVLLLQPPALAAPVRRPAPVAPGSVPEAVSVTTADELKAALNAGVKHIFVRAEIKVSGQPIAGPEGVSALLIVYSTTLSIRVRSCCSAPCHFCPPNSESPLISVRCF
jgi:hypothetical protein